MSVEATLIGDVVASRSTPDRRHLHTALGNAITRVNQTCQPTSALRITVGDEYQGRFATVGHAIKASIMMRLAVASVCEVRHGIGWGTIDVLEENPPVEDGPGWWAARSAIDAVHHAETERATRHLRTGFALADGIEGVDPAAVNGALLAHDALMAKVGQRGMSVLSGMLAGMSQIEIAEAEGITPSAVSQRVRGGLDVLHLVGRTLERIQ